VGELGVCGWADPAHLMRAARLPAGLALYAIRGYQRYLSPYKGFSCALRVATGGAGCSTYGHAVIARYGLRRGLGLLRRRLDLCSHVHQRSKRPPAPPHPLLGRQQGFCDLPDCDLPCAGACDATETVLELVSCGGDVRDCWSSRRREGPMEAGRSARMDALAQRIRQRTERRTQAGAPVFRPPGSAPCPATPATVSSPATADSPHTPPATRTPAPPGFAAPLPTRG